MTPGFAKSRQELFWLPYPEPDRVIINAHNFTPPVAEFDPSVNGKSPIAVWCPSRDDDGNGTTTLTDLIGSNNGTLINMDPATDWVADTGAGGIRALDFDHVNDVVNCGTAIGAFGSSADFAVSCWFYPRSLGSERGVVSRVAIYDAGWGIATNGTSLRWPKYNSGISYTISTGAWYHVVGVMVSGVGKLYVNGVLRSSQTVGSFSNPAGVRLEFGRYYENYPGFFSDMLLDDVRLFDQSLVLADVEYLYALGAGRGISA